MKKLIITSLILFNFFIPIFVQPNYAETVIFNPKTHKVHKTDCPAAIRCKICIKLERKAAYAKGGKPCHKCGG